MAEKEPEMFSTLEGEGHSSQQSRCSDEISNADLLSLMKSYFSNKLSGIERNFSDTTQDLARKVKKTENSLKFKGNQIQFEPNSDILDNIGITVNGIEHGRYTKAISVLQDSEKVLKKRNKLIRIADKSEGGWKTVDEYLSDDVASNSEDEKRIKAAENRAVKKLKTSKTSKRPNDKKRPAGGPSSVAHNGGMVGAYQ